VGGVKGWGGGAGGRGVAGKFPRNFPKIPGKFPRNFPEIPVGFLCKN